MICLNYYNFRDFIIFSSHYSRFKGEFLRLKKLIAWIVEMW
ncbi:Hypothetical protein EUBREC_1987 [Agathobacter rectalis ATCC 33656]|uniref:Uncharacterized protein n=1 Tax=Agathobacter rectalis (strain ATCC 33656 / DSM 3377 / JCM 17463 / KCTC 5835 / VPI 0990) TaxID=515619 RepID=C4ZBJ6_AGARV|nr:Hypothetical protein EUBREC_1987 [Agathobacter rectalis ATCC 33656]